MMPNTTDTQFWIGRTTRQWVKIPSGVMFVYPRLLCTKRYRMEIITKDRQGQKERIKKNKTGKKKRVQHERGEERQED
jgi:hypothetical protein